jgi:lysophospholipase L1-like esterase
MCPEDPGVKANFHLNQKGYKVVAKAMLDVIGELKLDT